MTGQRDHRRPAATWKQTPVANAASGVSMQMLTYLGEPTFGTFAVGDDGKEHIE